MMISGNIGPLEHLGGPKTERPADKVRAERTADSPGATPAPETVAGESAADASDVHRIESLRAAASRLLEQGDIDATQDGLSSPSRADLIRQRSETGTYDRREVLDRVVDRLIEQWGI